ncbi:hypothetical protein VHUM_03939 [Vanrija humicola]|uniref:Small ribosomal subunit protein mS29 n=1 Tax=Vanrija humicola TaxID=5417 RepID=A0A7D8UZ17_VANHU|nr:hypothetical protein VHUM_03939 [Vanrija humicola]
MSGLLTQLSRSVLSSASASTSRALSTSAVAAKAAAAKARQANATKGGGGRTKVRSGDPRSWCGVAANISQSTGLVLKTALAQEPADLTDLVQLYPESVIPLNVGKASTFPRNTYDQLKTFGLPTRLEKELAIGSPASVVRQATLDLVQTLEKSKGGSSKNARYLLNGVRGSGKSTLLVQAVSYALESGWLVLYAPRAEKWTDSSSQFAYNAASQTFHQPELSASLLSKFYAVNRDRLATVALPEALTFGEHKFAAGSKLDELVSAGSKDELVSVPILEKVLEILGKQTQLPVLIALDDVQTLFGTSKYRTPTYEPVEPYHLSAPRLFLDYFSGRKSFANGAIVTAPSLTNTKIFPSVDFYKGFGIQPRKAITEYTKFNEHHLAHAEGVKKIEVPFGLTGTEAAGMFELWTRRGWVANGADDVFMGGFTAAAGNPLELARGWTISHQTHIA